MASKPQTKPSITLFRGWDTPTLYVWSPFVTKLEFRLRLAGLEYKKACGSTRYVPLFFSLPSFSLPFLILRVPFPYFSHSLQTPSHPPILQHSSLKKERKKERKKGKKTE
jgi:hypothetical protein